MAEHAKRQASERTRSSVEAAATHTATHVPDNMLNGNLREVIWAVLGAESISFADRLQMAEQIEGDLFREDRATTTSSGLKDARMNTPHTETRKLQEMKLR